MSFDPTKPCRTRDGRAVEILTTKAAGHFPIVGNVNGVSEFESWTKNGDARIYSGPNLLDLVNYEPEPWALPDPPHGYEWLRADGWTKEMLPDGVVERPTIGGVFAGQVMDVPYVSNGFRDYAPGSRPSAQCREQ